MYSEKQLSTIFKKKTGHRNAVCEILNTVMLQFWYKKVYAAGVRQQRNETLENDLNNICYINIGALGIDR